jgi:hypothetical protein
METIESPKGRVMKVDDILDNPLDLLNQAKPS